MSWCTQELSIWCHQYCTASQQEMRKTAWGNSFDWPVKHFNFRPINENQLIHWQDSEREALAHLPDIIGWPFLTVSRKPWPTYHANWPFLKASRKPWPTYQTSQADPSSKQAGSPGPLTRHRWLTLPQSKQEALVHLPFLTVSRKPWPTYQTSLADPSSKQAGSPGPLTRHRWLTLPQSKQEALAHLPDIAGWPFLKADIASCLQLHHQPVGHAVRSTLNPSLGLLAELLHAERYCVSEDKKIPAIKSRLLTLLGRRQEAGTCIQHQHCALHITIFLCMRNIIKKRKKCMQTGKT